jgi:hypothetical protein
MTGDDPFLAPRDPRLQGANDAVRECLLRASPPARVFRQDDVNDAYALVVPSLSGERVLTVPGVHEADFMFHGDPGTSLDRLADFVARCLLDARADALRLPLLTAPQARALSNALRVRLPDWRFADALAAISPVAHKTEHGAARSQSLQRAASRARQQQMTLDVADTFPEQEIRALHSDRWGENRGDSFFAMLRALHAGGYAELLTLRYPDGGLAGAQLDIVGVESRHYYHSANDIQRTPGAGTAVLAASWDRFASSPIEQKYSFGRGAEHYKFRRATSCDEHFDVRGFYAPVSRASVAVPSGTERP